MSPFAEGVVLSRNRNYVVAEGSENHPVVHFCLLQGQEAGEKRREHVEAAKLSKASAAKQPNKRTGMYVNRC